MKTTRTVHGGADSALAIEVAPVRFIPGQGATITVETCWAQPDAAAAFGVYIRNPLAFHIQDFGPETVDENRRVSMDEARAAAFAYADSLADHLGCRVVGLERPPEPEQSDPFADLSPRFRAAFVDEMGMEATDIGGLYVLRHEGPGGRYMLVSRGDGYGMPTQSDWLVACYNPGPFPSESFAAFTAGHETPSYARAFTLTDAVACAADMIAGT